MTNTETPRFSREAESTVLSSGWDSTPVPALFGRLVRMATDPADDRRIAQYHGDLYHDALWLEAAVPEVLPDGGRWVFWFGFDSSGTAIGLDADLVRQSRRATFRVTLARHGYRQIVVIREWIR